MSRYLAFKLGNAIGFQLIWWSIAFWQNKAVPLAMLFVCFHFLYLPKQRRQEEIWFVFSAAIAGFLMDTVLLFSKILYFNEGLTPPIWLAALWMTFTCTLKHSLLWIFKKPYIALMLGGIGGPFSYLAAAKLGVIQILEPVGTNLFIMVFLWVLYFGGCTVFLRLKNLRGEYVE